MGFRPRGAIGGRRLEFGWGDQGRQGLPTAAIHRAPGSLALTGFDKPRPVYGMGHSEEVVAAALKKLGADLVRTYSPNAALRWDETGIWFTAV